MSTEIYVILLTVAALAVALIVKPRNKGQAETTFATGRLGRDVDTTPRLQFRCLDNGDLEITRSGLTGLTTSATVALAITRIGFDISIEERITPTAYEGDPVERATFILPGLAPERYHITYNSPAFSTFVAATFSLRPGIAFTRNFPV